MAAIVRTRAAITAWAPTADPQVSTFGYCREYLFGQGEQDRDFAPPQAGSPWWDDAVSSLEEIEALRGGIMVGRREALDANRWLRPARDHHWAPWAYHDPWEGYDGTKPNPSAENLARTWTARRDTAAGAVWAHWAPSQAQRAGGGWSPWEPDGGGEAPFYGHLVTVEPEPWNRSWWWMWRGATPGMGEDGRPLSYGTAICWGLVPANRKVIGADPGELTPKFTLSMPMRNRDSRDEDVYWTIYRHETGGDLVPVHRDKAPSGGDGQGEAAPTLHLVKVQPIAGEILIRVWGYTAGGQDRGWGDAWTAVLRAEGGVYSPRGQVGFRAWNHAVSCSYGWILYPDEAEITTPLARVPSLFTYAGEGRATGRWVDDPPGSGVVAATAQGGWVEVDEEARQGRVRLLLANTGPEDTVPAPILPGTLPRTGRRHTPIVEAVTEIHRTVLTAGDGSEGVSLADLVEGVAVTMQADGRGHTADLTLRDWRRGTGNTIDHRVLRDILSGQARIAIDLVQARADGADDPLRVFTGFAEAPVEQEDGLRPGATIRAQDVTGLWDDDGALMVNMPDPGDWDARDYLTLALTQHGVPEADIEFPDPWSGIRYPKLTTGGAIFSAETTLVEAIDKLCERCWLRWEVTAAGKVTFHTTPRARPAPVWVVDGAGAGDDFVLRPVSRERDFKGLRNLIWVYGADKFGRALLRVSRDLPSVNDDSSPWYAGRWRSLVRIEGDNPEPGAIVQREALKGRETAELLELTTRRIDLSPGDVVQFNAPGGVAPVGSHWVVADKSIRLDFGRGLRAEAVYRLNMAESEVIL